MPFPNQHAARQTDPSQYDSFANKELAPGITAILGIKDGKSEVQSVRFDKTKFEPDQAKKWLKDHDFKVDTFEEAVAKQIKLIVINKISYGVELGYALDASKLREGDNIIPLCIAKTNLPLNVGDCVMAIPSNIKIIKINDKYGIEAEATVISKAEGKPASAREIMQETIEIIEKSDYIDEVINVLKLKQSLPITKIEAQGVILNRNIPIIKDDHKQLIYGVVYEPDAEDAHGDYATADEIEKAAHGFMRNYRNFQDAGTSLMHEERINNKAEVVESFIAPCDYSIGSERIKKGSWVMATHVVDKNLWKSILDGEIAAYSMEGKAMEKSINKSADGKITKRNLVNMDIDAVALVDKGANKKKFYLLKREELIKKEVPMDEAMLNKIVEMVMAKLKEAEKPKEQPVAEGCKDDKVKKEEEVKKEEKKEEIKKDEKWYMDNPSEDIPDDMIPKVIQAMKTKE